MSIKTNLSSLWQELEGTSARLIAVTKTQPVAVLQEAYNAGGRIFGENKVQEMVAKQEALPPDIDWHLIGHLQSNKVKYIAPFVGLIHSVDGLSLLQEINKQGVKNQRVINCLLQMYIAQEETKFGLSQAEARALLASTALAQMTHVKIIGLMGMASNTDNEAQVRAEFRGLKMFFDALAKEQYPHFEARELSMGMSGDYPIALQEGATLIRVGSKIFGQRTYL